MKTKRVGDRDLPAKCFAYVGDPENTETWHLPYLNPDGSVDETHLAGAAAAFSPGGFRGKKVDIPSDAVAGVKAKLRAAYAKLGKKGSEIPEQLREASPSPQPSSFEGEIGRLIEAVGEDGQEWEVCLIKAGLAKSGTFYPPEVLREAVPLFNGVRALVRSDADHLQDRNVSVKNIVGWYDQPHFAEAEQEVRARFHLLDHDLAGKIREAWARGKKDLVGFSIVADGRATVRRQAGNMVRYAEAMTKVDFVDVIVNAGAGGRVIRMINAAGGGEGDMDKFLEMLFKMIEAERPELLQGKDKDNLKEEEILNLFREAMKAKPPEKDPAKAKEQETLLEQVEARLKEAEEKAKATETRFQEAECRNLLAARLADSKLPEITQAKIKKVFTERKVFTEAELDQAITDERDYLAKFHEATGGPGFGPATPGPDERDRVLRALDGFFFDADQKIQDEKVPRFKSFREAYVRITGDQYVTGRLEDAVNLKNFTFREALGTDSWPQIFGDSMTRRLLAEYRLPQYQMWRSVVSDIIPVNDFRENKRLRVGGYGDLPIVGEHDNYDLLPSPEDEEVGYAVSTRGGLEFLSRRMIINDDVGAIRRIPINLARAAGRTLCKAIFNIFVTNPVMPYDSKALFHADHANLGSAALGQTALTAVRVAMRSQLSYDGNDILGLVPKYLLGPNELEEMMFLLTRAGKMVPASGEVTDLPTLHSGMDYLVIDFWTDANDWVAVADPRDIPTIEVGFLQGREEPEVFVQDQPTQGYMFSSDKLAYKIRHEWGYAPLDHRGFQKNVVANP